MKTIITLATLLALALCAQILQAQEGENEDKIELLVQEKERIVNVEKAALKQEVEVINEKLANNEITREQAQRLKEEAAQKHALNIENALAIIDNRIALLKRNGTETLGTDNNRVTFGFDQKDKDDTDMIFGFKINSGGEKKVKYDKRTYSDFVIAFGLNNAIVEGQSLDDSDYKIGGSRFFEIGCAWRTRVFNNSNFLRIKYGISFQFNGLKPTDNRYFVENGNQTELQTFPLDLSKSKFRMDNLVVPVHLEFGPSKVRESEDKIRYSTHRQFRIGIGGYAGANISTRQKLKYRENGNRVKDKIKRDYNTSDLIYGLSTYIGFGDMSLYAKYDLSPIFRNATIDQNNVSLGLRFDL
ncbi:hypothetical protein [Aquimarina sp. 2201CG5-10]|uniref:hypothetical protein n=1 Tax=Aquimarina callyspongiae TaxID=3098150 RepID=UPI002AB3E9DC|nr:hypothetical protein [Aquimarina sp. 2201CG5-10]MDY8136487.1 hypothetical protein [Aquimarina sp. 2201CG5-10]